jgi:hypothetical protein
MRSDTRTASDPPFAMGTGAGRFSHHDPPTDQGSCLRYRGDRRASGAEPAGRGGTCKLQGDQAGW